MQGKTDWEHSVVNMNAILSCSLINSVGSGGATGDFQANRGIFGGGSGVKRRFKKRETGSRDVSGGLLQFGQEIIRPKLGC